MSVSDRISALTPEQRALFEALRAKQKQQKQKAAPRTHQPPPVPRLSDAAGTGDWPLSFDQERLWFLHELDPENAAFNIDAASRIRGPLDVTILAACLNDIVRRHAAWRTTFTVVDGQPVQRVSPKRRQQLSLIDLTALPAEVREPMAKRILFESTRALFDLEAGPLLRTSVIRLSAEDHICLLTVHHLVTDWIAFQICFREIGILYDAIRAGRPSPIPELPVHFSDYAIWQREWLSGEVLQDYLDYWLQAMEGFPLVLELPTDRPRPPILGMHGDRVMVHMGSELAGGLKALSRREGTTLFITFLALCDALLYRFSGQEKMILGSNTANRNRPEIEPIIGYFLTQLCFPVDLGGDPTFRELLARVRRSALGAYEHQDLPFGKLVEALRPERDTSRPPLIQTLVLVLDGSYNKKNTIPDESLSFEPISVFDGNARYDLMWGVYDYPDRIFGPLEFDADIFDRATVERLLDLSYRMAEAVVANPDLRLSQLPVTSEAARHQVLTEWIGAGEPSVQDLVPTRFAAQAALTPDVPALLFGEETVSYGELERRANRLAHHLREMGVELEVRAALLLERSPELVASILAVWKAGGAYVPLDPSQPAERLSTLLADAEPAVLIHAGPLPDGLSLAGARSVDLAAVELAGEDRGWNVQAGDLAYMIYTSGTTGLPKAVAVEHGSLAATLNDAVARFGLGAGERMPHLARFSFDISLFELFLPLLAGGACEILRQDEILEPSRLLDVLERSTRVHAVPSLMRQLVQGARERGPERFSGLRTIFTGGDLVPPELLADLQETFPAADLVVLYGPTEATIICTAYPVPRDHRPARTLIGRPLEAVDLRIVDRNGLDVPLGVPGELWVGGPRVARGYFRRDDLTAERFVERDGRRFYRTGDLVRHLGEGNLEFLGRTDHQVKIRGFRVEPGEIEVLLATHPAVREAVVVARDEARGEKRLVAYCVPAGPAEDAAPAKLREFLAARLPAYMVPSAVVILDELPLSAHGKLDRGRLPEPGAAAGGEDLVPPRTPTEELVAAVWCEVLGLPRVGRAGNFFDLGGHSLAATQVMMRLGEAAGVELPVKLLFQAPTVADLAAALEAELESGGRASAAAAVPLVRVSREDGLPLSFAQERLWFIEQLSPESALYNMAMVLRIRGSLDPRRLEWAMAGVAARQEALRTHFENRDGRPVQVVAPPSGWSLPVIDLTGLALETRDAEERRLALEDIRRPFRLDQGPLLRTTLVRLAGDDHLLIASMHHIISDAWSMGLLVGEFVALYEDQPLPDLPFQYADYAVWQRAWLQGEELERQLAFWKRQLADAPEPPGLPLDRPRPEVESGRGGSLYLAVSNEMTRDLKTLVRREGATLFMLLLTAWGELLARYTGERDLVIGTAIANRERAELERIIGIFVNLLGLRLDLGGSPTVREALGRARRVALDAYAHRDLPFERLVQEVRPQREGSRQPLFQTMFEFQNAPQPEVELPDLSVSLAEVESATAKFDVTWNFGEQDGAVRGFLEYASDLFDAATMERMAGHLHRLLAGMAADPDLSLQALPMLAEEESRQLVVEWNRTATDFPRERSLVELFGAAVARSPQAVALVSESGTMTYAELDRRSDLLARRLVEMEVGFETPVAVFAERSPWTIVGILGILKAGGFYVPLDPAFPAERLAWMVDDSGARLLVAHGAVLSALPEELRRRLPRIVEPEVEGEAGSAVLPRPFPESLAYVMYTSGSTGLPKGVAVTHRNVLRLVLGAGYADFGPDQTFLQFAPPSFDPATFEIWGALLHGGRLVLAGGRQASLDELAEIVARFGVTTLWLTSGLFHQMVDYRIEGLRPLKQLLTGGDVVSPAHARRVLAELPGLALVDGYGPTEVTCFTCCHRMTRIEEMATPSGTVPIGTPIANTRVYLLDGEMQPASLGVPGELYAGGDGLARGYFGRPDLTAERFVPDPFAAVPGERLYRTGDLVRWLPDGRLEFLGRHDAQVKIRGFRVEPGEVEAVLSGHPEVLQSAVLVRQDAAAGKLLAACVVPRSPEADVTADLPAVLQRFLRERLPEAMVPTAWLTLPSLPLTPNGKVDRRALAARLDADARTADERPPYAAPRTPLEQRLVDLTAEVLQADAGDLGQVGIHDNFFALGGHSLLATQLVARLRDRWGIEVPLPLLFEAADFAELADRVTESELEAADGEALAEMMAELDSLSPDELEALLSGREDASP